MQETSGIDPGNGIKGVGKGFSDSAYYERMPASQKKRVVKLRVGETVLGSVVRIPQKNVAVVRLPIGTVTAELRGRLKEGDTLLFKVEKIQPNLVLKIYSAYVKKDGKEVPISELLRILDLPEVPIFREVINFLKNRQNSIERNEVLNFSSQLDKLKNADIPKSDFATLMNALRFLRQVGIKFDEKIFSLLVPAFLGADYFQSLFDKLSANAMYLPENLREVFLRLTLSMKTKSGSSALFSTEYVKGGNLYSLLSDILGLSRSAVSEKFVEIGRLSESLINFIVSLHLTNALAASRGLPISALVPYLSGDKIFFIPFKIKDLTKKKIESKKRLEFTLELDTQDLGEVKAKGIKVGKNVSVKMTAESEDVKKYIQKNSGILREKLSKSGFIAGSVAVLELSEAKGGRESDFDDSKSISVVI